MFHYQTYCFATMSQRPMVSPINLSISDHWSVSRRRPACNRPRAATKCRVTMRTTTTCRTGSTTMAGVAPTARCRLRAAGVVDDAGVIVTHTSEYLKSSCVFHLTCGSDARAICVFSQQRIFFQIITLFPPHTAARNSHEL